MSRKINSIVLFAFAATILCGPFGSTAAAQTYNVRDFGAAADGLAKDTAAIQQAIDTAADAGGGTVFFPAGTYLTGSLYLKSNIDFYLGPGAHLLASPDPADYNPLDVCPQNSSSAAESSFGAHLILCLEQKNVTLRGPGKIDGNSPAFLFDKDGKAAPSQSQVPWRPSQMLFIVESENITIRDIELVRSPYWSIFLYGCENVCVHNASISTERTPVDPSVGPRVPNVPGLTYNGDGIDIDCCRFVTVSDCRISTADDCITLRGSCARLKNPKPCEFVTVTNCTLSTPCNAIRVGVGVGEIRHATFSNLAISQTRTAFSVVSNWSTTNPRGTDISDIQIHNVTVDCEDLFHIRYGFGDLSKIKGLTFSDITGIVRTGGFLRGSAVRPIENVTLRHIDLRACEGGEFLKLVDVQGLLLDSVRITPFEGKEPLYLTFGAVTDILREGTNVEGKTMSDEALEEYHAKNKN